MRFRKNLYLNWFVLIISIIIAILLWLNRLDVQRSNLDDTVRDSTIILRVVNFILIAEIFFTVSAFHGACAWYIINRLSDAKSSTRKKKDDTPWDFYDGGSTLFSTLKGFRSGHLSVKILSIVTVAIMITSYILDIYYIKSISYGEIEKCEIQNTTIDIMPSSQSSLSVRDPSSASIYYSFGSKIALLPYANTSFTTNIYTVPALRDTAGLRNYTTIEHNVFINCENPKLNMTAIKNGSYVAQASNGSYIELDVSTSQPQIIISAGSSTSNYTEIFITVGRLQDTKPIGVNSVLFGVANVSTAQCQTQVTQSIINNIYGWGHDESFIAAKDIAAFAQRASFDMFTTLGRTTWKTVHSPITEWLTITASITNNSIHYLISNVSMNSYKEKLTMIAIEYLKGGCVNGSMITPGYYCFVDVHVSHIEKWYKVVFTLVQIFATFFLISYTFMSSKTDTLFNDISTLLRFIINNK